MRLTVFYAGLFLLLGTVLLAIVFVFASRGGSISVAAPAPTQRRDLKLPGGVVITVPSPGGQDIVAQQHNADLARLLTISWVVLLVTTAGAAVLGWIAAGRVLRPVREITATARTISAGNLHERLARTGPNDEFKQLGDTLDDLLGRLEASFEAQRRFVANASHELRTPLTLERTLLQVALADPNAIGGHAAGDVRGAPRVAGRPGATARGAAHAGEQRTRPRATRGRRPARTGRVRAAPADPEARPRPAFDRDCTRGGGDLG